jgi:hypothetical protein
VIIFLNFLCQFIVVLFLLSNLNKNKLIQFIQVYNLNHNFFFLKTCLQYLNIYVF